MPNGKRGGNRLRHKTTILKIFRVTAMTVALYIETSGGDHFDPHHLLCLILKRLILRDSFQVSFWITIQDQIGILQRRVVDEVVQF